MSSIMSSQVMVLATAMAAVSGTVILLAFRLQKSSEILQPQQVLRSCISSDGNNKKRVKKKKRVRFADDLVDPSRNGDEFRKNHGFQKASSSSPSSSSPSSSSSSSSSSSKFKKSGGMPANRVALYNGILRDRVVQRSAYSY